MTGLHLAEAQRAFLLLPRGGFVMTSRFEQKRAGQFVGSVQPCAEEPMLVCIAARKGHPIEPLIRDSHVFAVCQVDPEDKLLQRKFNGSSREAGDPFDSLEVERLVTGAPILKRSLVALDCQVIRHLDVEADHELYIGQVVGGKVYAPRPRST